MTSQIELEKVGREPVELLDTSEGPQYNNNLDADWAKHSVVFNPLKHSGARNDFRHRMMSTTN